MHCFTYILVGYSSGGSEGVVVGVVGVVVIGEGGIVQRGAECLRCRRPIYGGRSLDIYVWYEELCKIINEENLSCSCYVIQGGSCTGE